MVREIITLPDKRLRLLSLPVKAIDDELRVLVDDIQGVTETAAHLVDGIDGRARAFVQVQQGCDHRCTFCVIPLGRGNNRSVPIGEIVSQVRTLVARGWREVVVADQRTAIDFAHVIKHLVDIHYPNADKIVLVMDNLNTHTPGSLYEAFEPNEARRLIDKLEIHYTPKHASWLDMAETELSVLTSQCLDRRIPDKATLVDEVTAWMHDRNVQGSTIDWRFSTPDARIKLKRLYPAMLP